MKKDKIYDFADEAPYKNDEKIKIVEDKFKNIKYKNILVINDQDSYHSKGRYLSYEIKHFDEKIITKEQVKYINKGLFEMIDSMDIKKNPHVLVVGLGNDDFSSDALGPETIKKINSNSHYEKKKTKISCIIPGVMKTTGLESASIIKSLVKEFKFDLVIVIDSLTTRNTKRMFKVVQITDTEIIPGSGINNFRKSLNSKYLGVPLLAIGISMAITYQAIVESIYEKIPFINKINKKDKKILINELNNDLILTSKDTELKVKMISENLSKILNDLLV